MKVKFDFKFPKFSIEIGRKEKEEKKEEKKESTIKGKTLVEYMKQGL
jgi:hypothetical protein